MKRLPGACATAPNRVFCQEAANEVLSNAVLAPRSGKFDT